MQKKRILLIIPALLLFLIGIGAVWASNSGGADELALAAMASDDPVKVSTDRWIEFSPQDSKSGIGVIIYPGGLVQADAYAVIGRALAEAGHHVFITPMPLNLAVLNPNKAQAVIDTYPEIDNWVIAGHSLGGAMAAGFAASNPETVEGLILWASYPAGSVDLSDSPIVVMSIYGNADGVAAEQDILAARSQLPENTVWVRIDGGNHSQFGNYGSQRGDGLPQISREEQQSQMIKAMLEFLVNIR